MRALIALTSGALFGLGLLISGMTDTTRVQGWLDLFGDWDPTLAFVLGGAILPMAVAWRVVETRRKAALPPVAGGDYPSAPEPRITAELAVGSTMFGMGWGLVGLCPGPAIASLSYGGWQGLLFLGAMIAGVWIAVPAGKLRVFRTRAAA